MEHGQEDAEEVLHSSVDATPVDSDEFEEGTGSGSQAPTPSPTSMPLRLQPPSTGQVPGRCSSLPGYKVGRGHGRGGATPTTAVASTWRRLAPTPAAPARNTSTPTTRRAAKRPIRDTSNGQSQVDESVHDTSHTTTPMDEDGDHVVVSDDDEEEDDVEAVEVQPSKRKLTSKVWLEMKKMRINGEWKVNCNWCHKILTARYLSKANSALY